VPRSKPARVEHETPREYARRSEALADAARNFHGAAAAKWIKTVQANQEFFRERVPARINMFLDRNCPNAGDVERRIGRKFGLIYAAGVFAKVKGILPWRHDLPRQVCGEIFEAVVSSRRERTATLSNLLTRLSTALLELPFVEDGIPNFETTQVCGYRVTRGGHDMFYIRREWLDEFCSRKSAAPWSACR